MFFGGQGALFPRPGAGCPLSQVEGWKPSVPAEALTPRGLEGVGVCWGADYDFVGALAGEEADGHYAGDLVDFGLEFYGIEDFQVVDVEDFVAVVGNYGFAIDGLAAQLDQFAGYGGACHGDDFYGQGEFAQQLDLLALVHDAYESPGGKHQDFLAGERRAAALDQAPVLVGLVGAVNIQVQGAALRQRNYFKALGSAAISWLLANLRPLPRSGRVCPAAGR